MTGTDPTAFVATRHGVILAHGPTAAAAAAAATGVSRCELRMPTPQERALLPRLAGRRLPADTEAQLLESIYTDITRLLWAVEDGDDEYHTIREPVFIEYRCIVPASIPPKVVEALERRRDVISKELDALDAMRNQGDLFAPPNRTEERPTCPATP